MQAIWIRSAALAAACLCGMSAPLAEQAPPQPPPGPANSMIAGRVIDAANGQGLSNASVLLMGGPPVGRASAPRSMLTDSRGRFVFPAIAAGKYQLRVDRAGYWSLTQAALRSVDVALDEKIADLAVPLHRYGSITGVVTDENGDPVSGMLVVGFRRQIINGQVGDISIGSALTDDRGAYRMAGLRSGEYFVCACSRAPVPFDGVLLNTLASQPSQLIAVASRALKVGSDVATVEGMRTYAPIFHGGSPTMAKATKLTIADGDERTNVDIQTPIVYSARVSGAVIGAAGTLTAGMMRLRPAGSPFASNTTIPPMLVQPDGRFDFAGVPAGEYSLEVAAPTAPRPAPAQPSGAALAFVGGRGAAGGNLGPSALPFEPLAWARMPITVVDRDIVGLSVTLHPAINVSGVVEWPAPAGPGPVSPQSLPRSLQLNRMSMETVSTSPSSAGSPIKPDGTFALANALPGRYALFVSSPLQVVKATIGDLDITDMPVVIEDRDVADFKVVLAAPNRPTIKGSVAGDVSSGFMVVVFPAAKKLWTDPMASSRWFANAAVSRNGAFTISSSSLPIGEYFIAALPDDQNVEWQSASRLELIAAKAQRITIGANEVKTIEVRR